MPVWYISVFARKAPIISSQIGHQRVANLEAERAIKQARTIMVATGRFVQTTLRLMLDKLELDEILAERGKQIAVIVDVLYELTEAWGIKVSAVEIKKVDVDESMMRTIARQNEAECPRRSKFINTDGEQKAA